ncbi:toxin-antitoxin system YwqK family antitoxin [Robertkochia sediminum]|uniref:toxin-antitoxin system YwqK family antitoxin n=1 Tax=Robertkochia sediminum TaxID=2785326 RepID=UPI0019316D77|nr:hypothetical protein [Robertkochia sediminum]MBL7471390.1 hypothetical protein [Robertkochia sediminum]
MKYYLLILSMLLSFSGAGQEISLADMEAICNKANWTSVNQFLMNKNWEYHESQKGDSDHYSTIVWSLNKSYNDEAEAWFYLYTHDETPVKVRYSVFNKPAYTLIQKALNSRGYTLDNSEIENNEIISTYSNSKFILTITTEKREQENSWEKSVTAYRFLLVKKSSVYDPLNGKKVSYYDDGTISSEYTLVNGLIEGASKMYHENGALKTKGNYRGGLADGKFQEFDEVGNLVFEWTMKKGERNGKLIKYVDNRIDQEITYVNGIAQGESVDYYYDEGQLRFKEFGSYMDDEREGLWQLTFIDEDASERVLRKFNYKQGEKYGPAQDVQGDSLIIANYAADKLHGDYKVYIDIKTNLFGGMISSTDPAELILVSEGRYADDEKTGYWKNYDLTGGLQNEGSYRNGSKTGEWKYYYSKYMDENDEYLPYSGKHYLTENYENGKLNGVSTRYSYVNREYFPCKEEQEKSVQDSCSKFVYTKVFEKVSYRNDELHGPLEVKDSLGQLVAKGEFRYGLKNGKWKQRFDNNDVLREESFYMEGNYVKDKREGEWKWYALNGNLEKIVHFDDDALDRIAILDSLGESPELEFDILKVNNDHLKFRMIFHRPDQTEYKVYRMNQDGEPHFRSFHMLVILGMLQEDSDYLYPDGAYKVENTSGDPVVEGFLYKENKIGKWIHYYYPQDVKIIQEYGYYNELVTEKYLTLSGAPFSGDFIYVDEESNTREVRSVKDGVRHGTTEVFDLSSGERLRKERYKKGEVKI